MELLGEIMNNMAASLLVGYASASNRSTISDFGGCSGTYFYAASGALSIPSFMGDMLGVGFTIRAMLS